MILHSQYVLAAKDITPTDVSLHVGIGSLRRCPEWNTFISIAEESLLL